MFLQNHKKTIHISCIWADISSNVVKIYVLLSLSNLSFTVSKEFEYTKRADRNRSVGRQTRPWPTK